jgi:IstB-like ATP binding protein
MSRYEKSSTLVTSNRPIDDWPALLGDVVLVAPVLDRLTHHGHLLKFDGRSWRLKEAAERVAKHAVSAQSSRVPSRQPEEFDPATGGGL